VKLTINQALFYSITFPSISQPKGPVVGFCEHNNKSLGFKKGGEFLAQLNGYQLVQHKYHITCKKENKTTVYQQTL
jgi:hypothetical protein